VRLNDLRQVFVVSAAAGSREGKVDFCLATQLGWSTATASGAPMVTESVIGVETMTLDSLVGRYVPPGQTVRLVKIDVEGFEVEALAGATELIAAGTAVFLVEVNRATLRAAGHAPADVLAPLRAAGYDIFRLDQPDLVLRRTRWLQTVRLGECDEAEGDIIAFPPGLSADA
jgi:FkbM family methyltransferase